MIRVYIAILFLLSNSIIAQEANTVFLGKKKQLVNNKELASEYFELHYKKNKIIGDCYQLIETNWVKISTYEVEILNDSLCIIEKKRSKEKSEFIVRSFEKKADSLFLILDKKNGNIVSKGYSKTVFPLITHGSYSSFYDNGQIASDATCINNQIISNERWLMNGDKALSNVFEYCDVLPEYPGGEKALFTFLSKTIRYPQLAKDHNIQGTVYVSFVVTEEGKLVEKQILKGHETLNEEALRVVNALASPWKPGTNDNIPIRLRFTLPISFRLK